MSEDTEILEARDTDGIEIGVGTPSDGVGESVVMIRLSDEDESVAVTPDQADKIADGLRACAKKARAKDTERRVKTVWN